MRNAGLSGHCLLVLLAAWGASQGCARSTQPGHSLDGASATGWDSVTVTRIEDVEWSALNPARGDAGPRAANVWGDRTRDGATGILVRFAEGFSSPPHIHNVTYRGVVLEGLIHNDDPAAAPMWMPTGSYWTQPAGEVHVTSAEGEGRLAYIEIESGPYLVMPSEQATDTGERAVNVHADNVVWLDASVAARVSTTGNASPEVAYLWGDPAGGGTHGALVKLPAGARLVIDPRGSAMRAVVISGEASLAGADGDAVLRPGSAVSVDGGSEVELRWTAVGEAVVYVRAGGVFGVRWE